MTKVYLNNTFDAQVWVKEWMETIEKHPDIPTDEGTMIGWFANAIMAGYDYAYRENEKKSKGIVIIGTGGMAKEIWGLCHRCEIDVIGFVVKRSGYIGTLMGLPILASDTEFLMEERCHCVIANGTPDARRKIAGTYLGGAHDFPNIIHHATCIFGDLDLGRGITIMPGGVIMPDVRIDDFVHINGQVFIGHDVVIGKYSVIHHRAGISGNVKIGEACLIGAGSTIIEGNSIGDGATVGAGAVITKDVPPGETWVGVPAYKLEKKPTHAELYRVNND